MPLEIYRRNGVWNYRGTVGPAGRRRRLRGSLHTKDKDIAARQAAEIEKRYWDGHFNGPGAILTFERACVMYVAAGKSEKFVREVRAHLGTTMVNDIKPNTIQALAMQLYGNCSGGTRNRLIITPICAVINHAAKSGLCNPVKVEHYKHKHKERGAINLDWILTFQKIAPPHLGAYALFMFCTGARPSEALAVDRARDLNLQKATCRIRETKTGKIREAHLPPSLVAALANLEEVKGRPLFGYRYYHHMLGQWKYYGWLKGKLAHLTPHCCRHGFVTELRRMFDANTVQSLGGPSPVVQDRHYLEAIKQRNLTNVLTDTGLTQAIESMVENARKSKAS